MRVTTYTKEHILKMKSWIYLIPISERRFKLMPYTLKVLKFYLIIYGTKYYIALP
jgi:hypothetical protein